MNKISSICSDISVDSLEEDFRNKSALNQKRDGDNVDTILVPFYEKDVLIKVPKYSKDKRNTKNKHVKEEKIKKESQSKSFLINKDSKKSRKASYLDIFRKQFVNTHEVKKKDKLEDIRSVSPQFGDTERGSLSVYDEETKQEQDFYNTEVYNEMYYEKLINQDYDCYLDNSFDEVQYTEDLNLKSLEDSDNLKSVSEVSQPRRHARRATAHPIQNMKLGGLGPDVENVRPRLERARSLQRYSEKVRMENRLKIYKQTLEEERQRKVEQDISVQKRESAKKKIDRGDHHDSYLINKYQKQNSTLMTRIYSAKIKSAGKPKNKVDKNENQYEHNIAKETNASKHLRENKCIEKSRVKSSTQTKGINTENDIKNTTPLEINFSVTVGGEYRPSSALRTLEEKHKLYQERIKTFT